MDPAAAADQAARTFVELGGVIIALAIVARLAHRVRFSPIPLYLLAGLAFGSGGLLPLSLSEDFIRVGADIGVVLLLFVLGVEYSGSELREGLRRGLPAGLVDIALNVIPGFVVGLLLGWSVLASLLLAGITYNTSSSVMAKTLGDLGRLGNRETPAVLNLSVMEDLTNTVYLPLVAVLLLGGGLVSGAISMTVAVGAAVLVLGLALRFGDAVGRVLSSRSDEAVLLSLFGLVLLVAGTAQLLQVSAAIGAFLFGVALSGPLADQARTLFIPLRDLFAATFFVFFGLQIEPASIPPVAGVAIGLGLLTTLTKMATGWYAARRIGVARRGRIRAGAALVARGEFSIVIAGLGAGLEPRLGPLAAAYVLFTVFTGAMLARFSDLIADLTGRIRPKAHTAEER